MNDRGRRRAGSAAQEFRRALPGVLLAAAGFSFQSATSEPPFRLAQAFESRDVDAPFGIVPVDLDGDGDVDLVAERELAGDALASFTNVDGRGTFAAARTLVPRAGGIVLSFDPDGDVDLLRNAPFAEVSWLENNGGGVFLVERPIESSMANAIHAADLDGDGDCDVITGMDALSFPASGKARIRWYANTDGAATFGPAQQIAAGNGWLVGSLLTADVDVDGYLDVCFSVEGTNISGRGVRWYHNVDGQGPFAFVSKINFTRLTESIVSGDLDGDGDPDFLAQVDAAVAWFENLDAGADFQRVDIDTDPVAGQALAVRMADVDGDGDLDAVARWSDRSLGPPSVRWYENLDGLGAFGTGALVSDVGIVDSPADGHESLAVADLDGDGDVDVSLSESEADTISWYENTDALGTFGPQRVVDIGVATAESISTADIDLDGDQDVLLATRSLVGWFENTAQGSFRRLQPLAEPGYGVVVTQVSAADLDGDGAPDLLAEEYAPSLSPGQSRLAWRQNGPGAFGSPRTILAGVFPLNRIFYRESSIRSSPVDLDGDGDLDILTRVSPNGGGYQVAWLENLDGVGTFGPLQAFVLGRPPADAQAADFDLDGDEDVLASYQLVGVVLYRNLGAGSFGAAESLTDDSIAGLLRVADLDGDEAPDLLLGATASYSYTYSPSYALLYWHANRHGVLGPRQELPFPAPSTSGQYRSLLALVVADFDGDRDLDLVATTRHYPPLVYPPPPTLEFYENVGRGPVGPPRSIGRAYSSFEATKSRITLAGAADLDGDGDADVLTGGVDSVRFYQSGPGPWRQGAEALEERSGAEPVGGHR